MVAGEARGLIALGEVMPDIRGRDVDRGAEPRPEYLNDVGPIRAVRISSTISTMRPAGHFDAGATDHYIERTPLQGKSAQLPSSCGHTCLMSRDFSSAKPSGGPTKTLSTGRRSCSSNVKPAAPASNARPSRWAASDHPALSSNNASWRLGWPGARRPRPHHHAEGAQRAGTQTWVGAPSSPLLRRFHVRAQVCELTRPVDEPTEEVVLRHVAALPRYGREATLSEWAASGE